MRYLKKFFLSNEAFGVIPAFFGEPAAGVGATTKGRVGATGNGNPLARDANSE
jgi:hypothetical protein